MSPIVYTRGKQLYKLFLPCCGRMSHATLDPTKKVRVYIIQMAIAKLWCSSRDHCMVSTEVPKWNTRHSCQWIY